MFDRRLIHNFDWFLLLLLVMLCAAGLTTLYSVTSGLEGGPKLYFFKQWVWYGLGLVIMSGAFIVDYKEIEKWSFGIYVVVILMLVAVLFFGKLAGGSRRWFAVGSISVQPSEFAKIAVILVLARYYSKALKPEGFNLLELGVPFALSVLPFLLISKQPDLGTGLVVLLIAGSISLFVKIERKTFYSLLILTALSLPMTWFMLKEYQRQRILTFINPDRDPLGAGYHIIQSKIAIGSGCLLGKGFLEGTQNILSFLPERHTDFAFSVFAEEWGFLGSVSVCLVFMLLVLWGLNIAYMCKDAFGTILCFGATSLIFWQMFINMGMIMGLMPVVGMPLPLISYGGSSIMTIMICIGLLMNVSMRRFRV